MNYLIEAAALLLAVFFYFKTRSSSDSDKVEETQKVKREDLKKTLSDLLTGLNGLKEKKKQAEDLAKDVNTPEEIERFYANELGQIPSGGKEVSDSSSGTTPGNSDDVPPASGR